LKLEATTGHGRFNLAGVGGLAAFIGLYSASDWIMYLISSIEDTIKTIVLKTDIHHPNNGPSFLSAVTPVLLGFGFCLLFLYFQEKRKDEILLKEQELNK